MMHCHRKFIERFFLKPCYSYYSEQWANNREAHVTNIEGEMEIQLYRLLTTLDPNTRMHNACKSISTRSLFLYIQTNRYDENRKQLMVIKPFIMTVCLMLSLISTAFGASHPNILFVIADDWGQHAGVYGTRWIKTPAFDRLACEGLLFKRAYTPMAKCAPSRACVLTGRSLWQNEEAGNHLAYFPAKLKSWPEVFMEKGWHMGITGKGWAPGVATNAQGKARLITGKPYNGRKASPPTSGISNNDYASNFVDFLNAAPKNAPWCFWCGPTEPHRGYEYQSGITKDGKKLSDIDLVPAYWPDNEIVRTDMLDYAFEVEHVDKHLGRMISELEKRGLLENTLIIATSDHGMPFPRVKGYAYHASNLVPLAIRWPIGIRTPGRVIEDFVDFTDIAPTLLDYAGISVNASGMQPVTGKSWRPIFESEKSGRVVAERDHVLIGKERTDVGRPHDWGYPIRGVVTATHLYLHNYEASRWPAGNPETGYLDTDGSPTKTFILELGRKNRIDHFWQLNFGMRPADELYNLNTDPDCIRNLAANPAQADVVAMFRQRMEAELKAQGDPRMFGKGNVFDEYKPTSGDGFYEKYMRGENPTAGWVNKTDFEQKPINQP
jgi:arylsulfatase A-like enzyme